MQYSAQSYRPDIDGLRALAVLAVIVYHLFPAALPGGYMGVDVFFVISGFLITGIINRQMIADRFYIHQFYARRVRRIFPALCLVLASVLVVGWFVQLPHEFQATSWHTTMSSIFLANIGFWREAGYFNDDKITKPLLHLWSLGVEEQFYLCWPLMLLLGRKWNLRAVLGVIVLASLVACVWVTYFNPDTAFYFPITRLWELGAGGLLALQPIVIPKVWRNLAIGMGVLLFAVAASLPDTLSFPGLWALIPVTGSLLVICAGPHGVLSAPFRARPAVFLGRISYPLYLWHWPVLYFAGMLHPQGSGMGTRVFIVGLSVMLAWATWRYVETPVRLASTAKPVFGVGFVMLALGLIGFLGSQNLVNSRLQTNEFARAISTAATGKERLTAQSYVDGAARLAGTVPEVVLFIGDSNTGQYVPRLWDLPKFMPNRLSLSVRSRGGCLPIEGVSKPSDPKCVPFFKAAMENARAPEVRRVVFAALWDQLEATDRWVKTKQGLRSLNYDGARAQALKNFEMQIQELRTLGKVVTIILTIPQGSALQNPLSHVSACHRLDLCELTRETSPQTFPRAFLRAQTKTLTDLLRAVAARTGADVIDPVASLCDAKACALFALDGGLIYRNSAHLTANYVRHHADFLDALLLPPEPKQGGVKIQTD